MISRNNVELIGDVVTQVMDPPITRAHRWQDKRSNIVEQNEWQMTGKTSLPSILNRNYIQSEVIVFTSSDVVVTSQ